MSKNRGSVISPAYMSVKIEDSRGNTLFSSKGAPRKVYPLLALFCEAKLDLGMNTEKFDTWRQQVANRLKNDWREFLAYEI